MLVYIFSQDISGHILNEVKTSLERMGIQTVVAESMDREDIFKLASASEEESYIVRLSSPSGEYVIEVMNPQGELLYIKKLYSKESSLPYPMIPAPSLTIVDLKTYVVRNTLPSWLPGHIFVAVATSAGFSPILKRTSSRYYFESASLKPPRGTVFYCPESGFLEVASSYTSKTSGSNFHNIFFLRKLKTVRNPKAGTRLIPYGVNVWHYCPW